MPHDLTANRLRELLDYDSATGHFTWRIDKKGPGAKRGKIAGSINRTVGYRYIKIDQKNYPVGALSFLWMTGEWPPDVIDHANMNKDDNRWANLRAATHSQNHANAPGRKNRTLPKGVSFDKRRGRFIAQININKRRTNLGRFHTMEEAHAAYITAARKHWGDFARFA